MNLFVQHKRNKKFLDIERKSVTEKIANRYSTIYLHN